MSKLIKFIAITVVILIAIPFIAIGILSATVDKAFVVEKIQTAVKEQTGGDLQVAGDLSWSVYPTLGLSISDVSYTDVTATTPLATIGNASVGLALMPLFSGEIHVQEIALDNANINYPAIA